MGHLEKGLQATRERIDAAVRAAARDPGSVALLAVSKTFPAADVAAAWAAGQRRFGENYVQEAVAKIDALAGHADIEWHLIGPLQGNKAKLAAERFDWVQSVDREKIARALSAARPAGRPPLSVCIQVNVSGEATKSGVRPEDALALATTVAALPGLRLRGIMGIPEPTTDPARERAQFRALAGCFERCRDAGLAVDTLSMGMSADLEVAIAEGATMVRVGTAIFGSRS
jgi:pyridoxal phosphate enzyme (YggS family)